MNRVEEIKKYVNSIISKIKKDEDILNSHIQAYGVAQCCSLLAVRRSLDTEIPYICGLLHDIYVYKTGFSMYHAQSGAEMARVAIRYMDFSEEEKTIILSSIYHHGNKEMIHDEYDELLKDAEILHGYIGEGRIRNCQNMHNRLEKVLESLNIPISVNMTINDSLNIEKASSFVRTKLGDIAENLAKRKIHGDKLDNDFMEIIKYFPENNAYDELKYGWCAAFVYHCAVLAGLEMPIRFTPTSNTRFACVEAWLDWSMKNGFCFNEDSGYTPSRGDLVIFDNIISKENKPKNTPWYDHIGIVLSCDNEKLIVAEGNVNNNNVSGIVHRGIKNNIGCYVRIPNGYEYDGWKYDYKTGEIRVNSY